MKEAFKYNKAALKQHKAADKVHKVAKKCSCVLHKAARKELDEARIVHSAGPERLKKLFKGIRKP